MSRHGKKSRIAYFVTIVLLLVAALFIYIWVGAGEGADNLSKISIRFPAGKILAEVADTPGERGRGLGGRQSLPDNQGMIFVFESPGIYPFWMKDMNFPIDMVWIGEDKVVKGMAENVSTSSYPGLFSSGEPILYVLELNAGKSRQLGVATGTLVLF